MTQSGPAGGAAPQVSLVPLGAQWKKALLAKPALVGKLAFHGRGFFAPRNQAL